MSVNPRPLPVPPGDSSAQAAPAKLRPLPTPPGNLDPRVKDLGRSVLKQIPETPAPQPLTSKDKGPKSPPPVPPRSDSLPKEPSKPVIEEEVPPKDFNKNPGKPVRYESTAGAHRMESMSTLLRSARLGDKFTGLVDKVITFVKSQKLETGVRTPKQAWKEDVANAKKDWGALKKSVAERLPKEAITEGLSKTKEGLGNLKNALGVRSPKEAFSEEMAKLRKSSGTSESNKIPESKKLPNPDELTSALIDLNARKYPEGDLQSLYKIALQEDRLGESWDTLFQELNTEGNAPIDDQLWEESFTRLDLDTPSEDIRFFEEKEGDERHLCLVLKQGNNILPFDLTKYAQNEPETLKQLMAHIELSR